MKRSVLIATTGLIIGVGVLAPVTANAATPTTGSVTVAVNGRSATFPAPVTCVQTAHTYRATATSKTVHGAVATISVAVANYDGPATYPAVVLITERQENGVARAVAARETVPVSITSTGGSVTVKRTTVNGVAVSGSARWTCD